MNLFKSWKLNFPPSPDRRLPLRESRCWPRGQSVLQSEGGVIYRQYPDGRKEKVKEIEPPTVATPGSRFTIK